MILLRNRAIAWGLLSVWAGAIWYASSISLDVTPPLTIIGFDKLGHFAIYAVFSYLAAHALATLEFNRPSLNRDLRDPWHGALLLTALWGWIDEIHQFWVPGRQTDPLDFVADVLGGCLGAWIALGPMRRAAANDQGGQM